MRRISALWESFFSKSLYSEAFYSWKGIGFLSLLLLVAVHTVIIFAKIHLGVRSFVHHDAPFVVRQVPPITFKDGKASTPEAKAYEIRASDNGALIAIIDTRISHPPADLGGAPIFLAGESIMVEKSADEQRSYGYDSMENRTVDQKTINYWLDFAGAWAGLICAPFVFAFLVVWRLIQLLFFSLATLLACSILGLEGNYAAKLRLTAMALIPALVVGILLPELNIAFFVYLLLFCAVVTGYIFFGVNAARASGHPAESEPETPPPFPQ